MKPLIITNNNPNKIKIETKYDKKMEVYRINIELRDAYKEVKKALNKLNLKWKT